MPQIYDVAAVAKGAQRFYNLAPNPVSFYLLTRAVITTVDEMQEEFNELPDDVKKVHENWMASSVKYKAKILGEQLQAKKLTDFIAANDPDWKEGLKKGTAYAAALQKFFLLGDSAKWANLANQLVVIKENYVKENPSAFPRWTRPVFFFTLWNPMLTLPAASTALALEAASGPVKEGADAIADFAGDAADAAADTFDDLVDFLKDVGVGIAVVAVLGLLIFIVIKAKAKSG